jgi:hypothetical protein
MLKKIALTGIFIFASAFSLSTATAVTGKQINSTVAAPKAPVPQGLCANGGHC